MNRNSPTQVTRFVTAILPWFSQNARDLPWRKTRDPYAIWVSEIMLQQTQVKTVIPYWERWMRTLPTVETLATAKTDRVLKLWEGLGYYHRARNMQNAAQTILREHQGKFPNTFDALLQLPGIGRYTAGAICSIAFNQAKPVVDGNAIRVLTRVFGIHGDPQKSKVNQQLWALAEALVQRAARANGHAMCSAFNQALMELGATICTAANPVCGRCPMRTHCYARRTKSVHALPQLPARVKAERRHFVAVVAEHKGKLFLRQRPGGVVNAGLWEFPNAEILAPRKAAKIASQIAGSEVRPLCTIQHTITRYRMTLEAFSSTTETTIDLGRGRWVSPKQASALAYPSAHRQVLERALQQFTRSTPNGAPAQAGQGENIPHDRRSRLSARRC